MYSKGWNSKLGDGDTGGKKEKGRDGKIKRKENIVWNKT